MYSIFDTSIVLNTLNVNSRLIMQQTKQKKEDESTKKKL
jgi:hypothetical protein